MTSFAGSRAIAYKRTWKKRAASSTGIERPDGSTVDGERLPAPAIVAYTTQEGLMRLNGKRIVVLAEDMYEELELWYPYYRLREEGAEVILVGPEAKMYASKYGYPATASTAAAEVRVADVDAVIAACSISCAGSTKRAASSP
jgi:hypothetical protein